MKKYITLLMIALLLLVSCQQSEQLNRYQRTIGGSAADPVGFDTSFTLIGYTKSETDFDKYLTQLRTEIHSLHQLFDKYNNYEGVNNLKTINDNAGKQAIEVDPHLIKVLLMSKEQHDENYQKFDPTLGAVLNIWHDYREEGIDLNFNKDEFGKVPPLDILQEAKECTGWDLVEIDESKNTVYLNKDCASLDLGGIAKGYATELVSQSLYNAGLKHFTLSSGGNIKVMGLKPNGDGWNIGIREPLFVPIENSVDVLSINQEMSIVTSGDYQRFYYGPDMVIFHHLIDPETLMPLNNFRSATIVMKDSGYADLYSTVLFNLDYETGKKWVKEHNEKHPDMPLDAFWVIDDKSPLWDNPEFIPSTVNDNTYKISMTEGLKERSRLLNP